VPAAPEWCSHARGSDDRHIDAVRTGKVRLCSSTALVYFAPIVSASTVTLSGDHPEKEERRAAAEQSVGARTGYVAERRGLAAERDARRYELARAVAPEIEIAHDRGFARVEPGRLPLADGVVRDANATIDSIGHELMLEKAGRKAKPHLVGHFIDRTDLDLDSPYLRFALSDEVLDTVTAYFGVVPVLYDFDVWYTVPWDAVPKASQMWHLDHDDVTQVKVWVYVGDIGPETGPTTVLDARRSTELVEKIGYDMGEAYRIPDEDLAAYEASGEIEQLTGAEGTVYFIDTSRCFHMGGRVDPGATPRRTCYFQFVTPYSFNFGDHRDEAQFRDLADRTTDERVRLVLGAR
jgi:hypothetical protein